MKRLSGFLSLLLCLTVLCSCSIGKPATVNGENEQSTSPSQVSVTHADGEKYFMLERLPDIGTYTDKNEVYGRWYKEYTDRLIPRTDYGELVPFLKSARDFTPAEIGNPEDEYLSEYTQTVCRYGLATTDGKIVVDAVYDWFDYHKLDNGKSIISMGCTSGENESAKGFVAASDGSWVAETKDCYVNSVKEGRIVVWSRDQFVGDYEGSDTRSLVYDYDGKLLFEKEGMVREYSEGLASFISITDIGNYEYRYNGEYIDKDGKTVITIAENDEQYPTLEEFENGTAGVTANGLFGIVRKDVVWVIEPSYNTGWRLSADAYFISDNINSAVFNNDGTMLRTLPAGSGYGNVYSCNIDGCDCEGVWYEQDGEVKNAITGSRVICKESGLPAAQIDTMNGYPYFTCVDGNGVKYLLDHKGNTLYKGEKQDEYEGIYGNIIEVFRNKGAADEYNVGDRCLINRTTGKVIEKKTRADEDEWYAFTGSDLNVGNRLVVSTQGNRYSYTDNKARVRVMNTETGEYLTDEYEHIDIIETGAGIYYHAIKGNYITLLDKDFKVVMRLLREKTD